jgi:hypothetical protein
MEKRDFGDILNALASGLQNASQEIGAEINRLGKQGALEMAQALFNGAAFTPYGPGQVTPPIEQDKNIQNQEQSSQQQDTEHSRDGLGR